MRVLVLSTGIRDPENAVTTMTVAGLESAGQTVFGFDPYLAIGPFGMSGCQRLILQTVQFHAIDWVLGFPPYDLLTDATARQLRDWGVPVVGFRYDDPVIMSVFDGYPHQVDSLLLAGYDRYALIATSCQDAADRARALGAERFEWWSLPTSPANYPLGAGPKRYDVSLIGSAMADLETPSPRVALVRQLLAVGIDVHVWGSGWSRVPGLPPERVGGRLSFADMVKVFQESWLSLTPSGNHGRHPRPMVKFRNLEVASCGGVQVQRQCRDMDAHFQPQVEYLPFTDDEAVPDLVRRALSVRSELAAMGVRAAARVRRDHDWGGRATAIVARLCDLGFGRPKLPPDPAAGESLALAAMLLGHLCEKGNRPRHARSYYEDTLRYHPEDGAAWAGLARLAESDSSPIERQIDLWRHVKTASLPPRYNRTMSDVDPLPGLGRFVRTDPVAEAACHLATLLNRLGRFSEAAEEARTFAYVLGGSIANVAMRLLAEGHPAASERVFGVLVDQWPEDARFVNQWGVAKASMGDLPGARACFQQAIALQPDLDEARQNLARVEMGSG